MRLYYSKLQLSNANISLSPYFIRSLTVISTQLSFFTKLFPRNLKSVPIEVDLLSVNLKQVPQLQEPPQVIWWCQINRLYKGLFALHTAAVISTPDILADM